MAISPLPNMIGPQVSGPLGGANFLSVDEMTSGTDRANKIANQSLDTFTKAYNLGEGMQAAEAAKKKKAELGAIKTAEYEAQNQFMQQQTAPAPQTSPIAPVGTTTPIAQPSAAPATPLAVAPVQTTPSAPLPAPAAPVPVPSVEPQAQPVAEQSTPTQPAVTAPMAVPVLKDQAQPAPKSAVDRLLNDVTLPGGGLNRFAQPVVDSRKQLIAGLVQQGKVSPETAQEYIETIDAAREKAKKETIELESKIADIADKNMSTREKAVKVKVAMREADDNNAFTVYQTMMQGDKDGKPNVDGAKLVAEELSVDFDGSPKAMKQLELQAKRSPDYKAAAKEARDTAETNLKVNERSADKDTGYFFDKQGRAFDADGNRVSSAEIQAAQTRMKQAGRAVTNIGRGTGAPDSSMGEGGELRGLSRDKQGNWTLSKDVQTNLAKSRVAAEAAANAAPIMKQLRAAVETGKGSESKIGSMAAAAGEYLPDVMKPEITQANQRINNAANALIGLLNDPRLKGNPTKQEAEAVMKIIADPQIANSVKMDRIAALEARFAADMEDHNAAVAQYDEPTRARLKATGLNEVGDRGPKAPAQLSGQDKAAADWAKANPKDPRAAAILKKLGM